MDYATWKRLLAQEDLPTAIIDLDAVDRNLEILTAPLEGTALTLRVASKSLRHPRLLRYLLERDDRLRGLMAYSTREAAFLADQGFDDLLVAYPAARRSEADALAALATRGVRVIAMVDSPEHLTPLRDAAGAAKTKIPICVDADASLRLAGQHLGVRRSPIRGAEDARALAGAIQKTPGVELVGLMAYEAQVAGVRDRDPRKPLMAPAIRWMKGRSVPMVRARRAAIRDALAAAAPGGALQLVNGGGTGSVHSTARDPSVTEITAGSGFLCPHLFDGYRDLPLRPAAFFALAIARRSDPGFVTCSGGGYPASGEAGPDRLPLVHQPPGLRPIDLEGWGEVQTPFKLSADAPALQIGDPVIARHAKAGELMERFPEVLLIRGGEIVERAPSYRGLGQMFL